MGWGGWGGGRVGWGGGNEERCGTVGAVQSPRLAFEKRVRKSKEEEGRSMAIGQSVAWWDGSVVLLDDHAVGQVLGVVFEEFGGGSRAVGQLQLFQLLQLDEA